MVEHQYLFYNVPYRSHNYVTIHYLFTRTIIHCVQMHRWIAASIIGFLCNSVNVYDSFFSNLDDAMRRLINNMFGTNDACKISMEKSKVQAGVKDCGAFAITFITPLVHGKGLCDGLYDQENFRQHLIDCFERLMTYDASLTIM